MELEQKKGEVIATKVRTFGKRHAVAIVVAVLLIVVIVLASIMLYQNYRYSIYTPTPNTYRGVSNPFATVGDNNDIPKYGEQIDAMLAATPSDRQTEVLDTEYYNFIYYGMNTMTGEQEGTGKETPAMFNPSIVNTEQWCSTLNLARSQAVILTAKYYDGFCLWQSEVTEHAMQNSPYKNGKGDIVLELADSARNHNLKFGVYIALWDKHAESFGTAAYNDYFDALLREVLARDKYGGIFYIYLDTYIPPEYDVFDYDMDRFIATIYEMQNVIVIAGNGATDYYELDSYERAAQKSSFSVVSAASVANGTADGTRDALSGKTDLVYSVAEYHTTMRKSKFYSDYERPRALRQLTYEYFKVVGGNANYVLGVAPSKTGVLDSRDTVRLTELGESLEKTNRAVVNPDVAYSGNADLVERNIKLNDLFNETLTDSYAMGEEEHIIDFHFRFRTQIGRIDIREDVNASQRVEAYELWIDKDGAWVQIAEANAIGNRAIFLFKDLPRTYNVRLVIRQSRGTPVLRSVRFYESIP